MAQTKDSGLSDAAICRRHGWKAGTQLAGNEGYGTEIIEITAVGREGVLAIWPGGHESHTSLTCRNWREVVITEAEREHEQNAD